MKEYNIEFTASAVKSLKRVSKIEQTRIIKAIKCLAQTPRPTGVKKLKGANDLFRIRIGQYRVVYSINDNKVTLLIIKIGHRKDIYKH